MSEEEPRRAEAYAARRLLALPALPYWSGYARCSACPWWSVTPDVDSARAAAVAHRCPEPRP